MSRMVFRNQQPFWYALYDHTAEDEYGNEANYGYQDGGGTVSPYVVYKNPVKAYGNISAARGTVETRQFGDDLNYDKVIVVGDRDTPIDEYAVLWIDREPEVNLWGELKVNAKGDYLTPWDYIVRRVGRGLPNYGSAVIAVSKVNVT